MTKPLWNSSLTRLNIPADLARPWWSDYRALLSQFEGTKIPPCAQLNRLLPLALKSGGGQSIRFVPSTGLDDAPYEQRIYSSGQVCTRADNWHDFFNALVWLRFPHIKTAMNALHYAALTKQKTRNRGPLRDALTLFDECGVIVISTDPNILDALSRRRWSDAFRQKSFNTSVQLAICGHAMLEKFLSPYKSMTAKALLLAVDEVFFELPKEEILIHLDNEIAQGMLTGDWLTRPACLAPLPLAGVPGWWPGNKADPDFYLDQEVFRSPPENLKAAPVKHL